MASSGNSGQPNNDNNAPKNRQPISWLWIILLLVVVAQGVFMLNSPTVKTVNLSQFRRDMLETGDVQKIVVVNNKKAEIYIKTDKLGQGKYSEFEKGQKGPQYVVNIGSLENFESMIEEEQGKSPIEYGVEERTDYWGTVLSWVIPFGVLILLWVFILNRARGGGGIGGGNIFDFGKSKATLFQKGESKITFDDVAGLDEVKVEVREVVDFLKNPDRYTKLGAKIPKGVLLVGPPGTGKTLLAKAVAGEAGVPFYSMSGSEFVEMFVGVGASRVRDLFRKAKQNAPSIVFIDEIDAIGRSRGKAISFQGNDERENTLNQMLTEMDGFGSNSGVIVMAATNRGEILDSALLRPGRFDRQIYLELPTKKEREAIFKVHLKPLRLASDVDLEQLSSQTPGFSGADIANICNEAALIAARKNKDYVEMMDFMDAVDRIVAGLEKTNRVITDREKRIIAYHEAGHATASWHLPNADSLLKVSIVPRGRSLGAAWYLPEEKVIYTKDQFMDRICSALAGRASEEITFGKVSSGALDDLEKVTKQAYTMVAYYGLNEALGNISYYDSTGQYETSFQKPYSEATAQKIDDEVRKLVAGAYERTKNLLIQYKPEMETLAEMLLKKEVVYKKDLEDIFGERQLAEEESEAR